MPKQAQIVAAAVIALIIIAGVAFFVVTHKSKSQPQVSAPVSSSNQATQGAQAESVGNFKTLLAMNKNVSCETSFSEGQVQTNGTVFVSGKQMRGDFTVKTSDGKTMDSHMISDGAYIYTWSSAAPQGIKMKAEALNASPSPVAGAQKQGFDMNQNVSYKCSDWTADNSKFALPANIQFMDISQMTKTTNQTTTGSTGGGSMSSVCNQLTDPQAKAACIAAYGSK